MIQSEIRTVEYANGEMQRYQIVSGFRWEDLEFARPPFSKAAFSEICRMYSLFIVPKHRDMYGALVLFHLPDGMESPFPYETEEGTVFSPVISSAIGFNKLKREGRIWRNGNAIETDDAALSAFIKKLEADGWLYTACGDLDDVTFLPVGSNLGYLSQMPEKPSLAVNSQFFEMDRFDNDSPYDLLGTPYGMIIEKGIVYQPPLNGREAFAVYNDGRTEIIRPDIRKMGIEIQGTVFRDGENCTMYRRPDVCVTDRAEGLDIVIAGNETVAFHDGGSVRVPMGGFVIHTEEHLEKKRSDVIYHGLEDIQFAVQVGSSAVKNFEMMDHYESPFYNIYKDKVPYPPTLYPLDYASDRAPRMVIAADKDDSPLFIWAEGCSKLGYERGKESAGTSLLELAEYCRSLGLKNAINLDGGGSSEIFIDGKISMKVSARLLDGTPAERPIPMGIMVR